MRVIHRAKSLKKARLLSVACPFNFCILLFANLINPQTASADVTVRIPDDWIDMGLGTGTIYDIPPNFLHNDLPETRLTFPDSKYLALYGFRAYIPAKKCPRWNRAQFSIDYSEIPAEGNSLADFSQNFMKTLFVPNNHGDVSIFADRQVIINQAHTHRIDLRVRSTTPHFCGTHYLNATFIKVNPQIVFIAIHDIGVLDAIPNKMMEQIIRTIRPLWATVIHYKDSTSYPLINPDQSENIGNPDNTDNSANPNLPANPANPGDAVNPGNSDHTNTPHPPVHPPVIIPHHPHPRRKPPSRPQPPLLGQ